MLNARFVPIENWPGTPTPGWKLCAYCSEEIREGEDSLNRGSPLHRECLIRAVIGSAAHQLGDCTCHGGTREDPPGMTPRQAAKLAFETFQVLHKG